MGELVDYLVQNDENFRKSRLPALYSDFRPQRTLNPDGYRANINAWRNALSRLASSGLLSRSPSSSSSSLVLGLDTTLLRALADRQFGQPLALGTAVRETITERGLVSLPEFLKSPTSVYYHGWGEVPWNVMGWTLRQLGVVDPSRGDDKLPTGRYVIMQNVEAAGKVLEDALVEKTSKFERVYTKKQFQHEFAEGLLPGQRLGDEDMDVLLRYASRDKVLVEYDGKIVKLKATGDTGGISEEDATIASIKELTASLQHQIDLLTRRTEELEQAAKTAVAKKQRVAALAALKFKKLAESSLSTRYATLTQLQEVAARIEQASDQVQLVEVMKSSTRVLKDLNEKVGGAEKVDGIMDGLREQMADTDEVAAIISEGGREVDESELDDELESMEREERERANKEEEEKERKKMEQVPEVPREATPTTETGIADLSMEDKEREGPIANAG